MPGVAEEMVVAVADTWVAAAAEVGVVDTEQQRDCSRVVAEVPGVGHS